MDENVEQPGISYTESLAFSYKVKHKPLLSHRNLYWVFTQENPKYIPIKILTSNVHGNFIENRQKLYIT